MEDTGQYINFLNKIRDSFRLYPDRNALYIGGRFYSFKELERQVGTICDYLLTNCVDSKAIGVVGNHDLKSYASILAIMFLGKTFIPILNDAPEIRNEYILNLCNVNVVLNSRDTDLTQYDILTPDSMVDRVVIPELIINQEDILSVLFTSGTTGVPKGVPYTFKNINCTLDAYFKLGMGIGIEDKFLQMFDFNFDMSMLSYLPAFCIGACIYPCKNSSIKYLNALELLLRHEISIATMVPTTLHLLRPYFERLQLPNLKYSLLGGEPFSQELANQWMKCIPNGKVFNISGPTETTMACMGYWVPRELERQQQHNGILAFGLPWPNTRGIIVDSQNKELPKFKKGNLSFSGDNVMQGYLNQEELNKEVFFYKEGKRFYKTGDIAFIGEDDTFYTCGRSDNQVKINGYKVELSEVEHACRTYLKLSNVYVAVMNSGSIVNRIVVFYESSVLLNSDKLISVLREKLPPYMVPQKFVCVKEFPRNNNGKIDKQGLKESLLNES
ncbi:AMP-binding protein [Carboxylicivirga caseinilyticus]|uniref:AMP-binding protein n=1 Tax=Carboxylicivirga caseinilyticus TaxID=3417572 RepID=UPI003D342D95|nr:AMP-binding protein [Marinilabiliaceae bacterium A049]